MKSVTLQDSLIDRFKLLDRYEAKTKTDARLTLTGSVKLATGKDGLMSIVVEDKDPQFAADLANAHVEELAKLLSKLATTEAQQRRHFFEKQLNLAKDKLIQSEIALRATGVSSSVLKSNPASAVAAVAGLQAAVTAQEVKLGAMRGYLAESAPDFKLAMIELTNLRVQLAEQERDTPSTGGKANIEAGYITKYREFKYHETLFELFSKQLELAKVDEAREGAVIQVLDAAEAPERKAKPKKAMLVIFSTLTSGFSLLLFVFIKQQIINASQDDKYALKMNKLKNSWRRLFKRS
jgi:capsule polysaccharide export protein KpsE/RkpR